METIAHRDSKKLYVFIHVPKNAGQTIHEMYYKFFNNPLTIGLLKHKKTDVDSALFNEYTGLAAHDCAVVNHLSVRAFLDNKSATNLFQADRMNIHAVIRDPIDRAISRWNYVIANTKHGSHERFRNMGHSEYFINHYPYNEQFYRLSIGDENSIYDLLENIYVIPFDYAIEYFRNFFRFGPSEDIFWARKNVSFERFPLTGYHIRRSDLSPKILSVLSEKTQIDQLFYEKAKMCYEKISCRI